MIDGTAEPPPADGALTIRRRLDRHLFVLLVACITTLSAWAGVVPPFEAPDESHFSQLIYDFTKGHKVWYQSLFLNLTAPVLHAVYDPGVGFDVYPLPRNPAFRFVSNQPAQVNMFMHGRYERPHPVHERRVYAMRAIVVAVSTVSVLLIYLMARTAFGSRGMGLLVAGLCLLLPQFSFIGSKVHPEVLSTLWGSAVSLIVVLRATNRLSLALCWVLLLALLVTAPLTDSTALFLIPFTPLAMIVAEADWRARAITAAVLLGVLLVAGAGLSVVASEIGTPAGMLQRVITQARLDNLGALASPFAVFTRDPGLPKYFLFEFTPKMLFGFFGWMGQPSILLPAWLFAAFFITGILAGVGLIGRLLGQSGPPAVDGQNRILIIAMLGAACMLAPIVYAAAAWNRNEWYGRWLFPMVGLLMVLVATGIGDFTRLVRHRSRPVAGALGAAAVFLVLAWVWTPGEWIRAGVGAFHYGDQAHLIRTLRDTIVMLVFAAIIVAAIPYISDRYGTTDRHPRLTHLSADAVLFASAWALNLLLLFAFVRPLYQPLDAAGYVKAIDEEKRSGELKRAAGMARMGSAEFPESAAFASEAFSLSMRTGQLEPLKAYVKTRANRGFLPRTRSEVMALARLARRTDWSDVALADQVTASLAGVPGVAEERAWLQTLAKPNQVVDAAAMAAMFRDARGTVVGRPLRDGVVLEGFTLHPLVGGRRQVVVYFRPTADWNGRLLWLHAYPAGSTAYVDVGADPPAFGGWRAGELAWEVFETPQQGRFVIYAGVAKGSDIGPAVLLGTVGDASDQMAVPE